METFKASNGEELNVAPTDHLIIPPVTTGLGERTQQALREFFQHERDQELGRWRWPENPDVVVQADKGGERAWVVDERNQQITGWVWRADLDRSTARAQVVAAARAYFDAHPEPKPWHDARDGQLWIIRFSDYPNTDVSALVKNGTFVYNDHYLGGISAVNDITITAGRRIWPEVSDA